MKNRNNNPISFGITLVSSNRTKDANIHPRKRRSAVRRQNTMPEKTAQMPLYEFECPRTKMPPPAKPFTPDMFTCEHSHLPAFPPQEMSPIEERVQKELERSRSQTASQIFCSRTASYPSSKKSSSMGVSFPWEFFKVVLAGVFVFFKYAFIAVAAIITIGCMLCAGRQTTGLR